jgi:hypothetical protein
MVTAGLLTYIYFYWRKSFVWRFGICMDAVGDGDTSYPSMILVVYKNRVVNERE